jgi:hypothetical protein
MEVMACEFFKESYVADPYVQMQDALDLVQPRITPEINEVFCKGFSDKEISDAMFQIESLKAPGPDGFPACFFQRHWDTMKGDVIRGGGVRKFFETGHLPPSVNETAIVLIPKKDEPEVLKDFWPISLCNVIYKVVSKCMVNRLRPVLQDVIGPMQSAFVPRRMIMDNALIAFECLHVI